MGQLEEFRAETRAWLEENCPSGARGPGQVYNGSTKIKIEDPDVRLWVDRMVEKGWTVPNWPTEYGGGGLATEEYLILLEEMRSIAARPALSGFGTSMIGPTLLEFGTEEQKQRHLKRIARAEVEWCQGYSEPGSGSDLASLRTAAQLDGDNWVINGQKIWTSGAQHADWMFILVRTDPNAPKHEGISFLLLPMDQDGVTIKPIRMISGESPFNETFFDNALADKRDLVGDLNRGWTVGKRLLQHERSGMESLAAGGTGGGLSSIVATAKRGYGEDGSKIAEPATRENVLRYEMDSRSLGLTQRRVVEESLDGKTPGFTTSIFKVVSTELQQDYYELQTSLRGTDGYGWEGDQFEQDALGLTRNWLYYRAASIYSGSNEVQRNIIAKRVLGLPD